MKILVLSFFYPPDLSAGSFRIEAFMEELRKQTSAKDEIHLLTNFPNRYMTFTSEVPAFEQIGNIHIHRCQLRSQGKGFVSQVKRFLQYSHFVKKYTRNEKYDLVFATSSRMFTAALGVDIAVKQGCPSYIDIRDLFVDTFKSLFSKKLNLTLGQYFKWVEKKTFTRASQINVVSPSFSDHIKSVYPTINDIDLFTNGVDDIFIDYKPNDLPAELSDYFSKLPERPTFLYAGNIGRGQDLDIILPSMALKYPDYDFVLVGDGNAKVKLEEEIEKKSCNNIFFFSPISREFIPTLYAKSTLLFLHLGKSEALEKVIPSKLFEYAASGKPILAGIQGYSKDFCRKEISNCQVFSPGNIEEATKALDLLSMETSERSEFIEKFNRTKIITDLVSNFLELNKVKK